MLLNLVEDGPAPSTAALFCLIREAGHPEQNSQILFQLGLQSPICMLSHATAFCRSHRIISELEFEEQNFRHESRRLPSAADRTELEMLQRNSTLRSLSGTFYCLNSIKHLSKDATP